MLDIKAWLKTTELEVTEERYIKPPSLPYVIFTQSTRIRGSDTENNISERAISVELYSETLDKSSEELIEYLLYEKAIHYSKDRIWIDKESMFETIYDFNLIEKI